MAKSKRIIFTPTETERQILAKIEVGKGLPQSQAIRSAIRFYGQHLLEKPLSEQVEAAQKRPVSQ